MTVPGFSALRHKHCARLAMTIYFVDAFRRTQQPLSRAKGDTVTAANATISLFLPLILLSSSAHSEGNLSLYGIL